MLQYIRNDVRKIFLSHQLLAVTQLNDPVGYLLHRLIIQLQSQLLQILPDVCLSRSLAQCILADTAETFRQQVVTIEIVLVVSVGMYSGHLGKHTVSHNGFVRRNDDTGIRFHHAAHLVQPAFVNVCHGMEMVFQDRLHTGQRSISRSFTQTVDGGVQSFHSAQHGSQHITYRQIVVIVRMKVEMQIGITLLHLAHILDNLQRIEHPQRIRKHEPTDSTVLQAVDKSKDIFRRILDTVTPVFQIDIDFHPQRMGIFHNLQNVTGMLFKCLFQLIAAMFLRSFRQQIDHPASRLMNPVC